jgi:L-ribulose-5-phosphate 3-epimerase
MIKGINEWAFAAGSGGTPFTPLTAMKRAHDLGYDCFEHTIEAQGLLSPSTTRGEAEQVRKTADEIGIRLLTVASGLGWASSPTHPKPEVRDKAVSDTIKMLEIASWLGAESILYLPGMVSAPFIPDYEPQLYTEVDRRAKEALRKILPTAEKLRIKVAVENVWNRYLLSPVEMRDFIDSFNSPAVAAYFDVGNVLLYGHPEHWIEILGARIAAVHMKDFRVGVGNLSGFVDMLAGDVDFPKVMKAFKSIGYSKALTAEIVPGTPGCVEKAIAALRIIEKM